ncbi:tryptophan synthase subunit alpha [Lentzea sp. NBRC 105346]|uniref:tryptophan synthase subunit alpha n=1 Tax=Lentzea sp. NBRC 105346 TaxID=3032205 RepID=UPI0024A4775D|nr:tryptophan synthase subunit alpha [Lentzea sp. NBRC 105346]GLZ30976.1 tryptophan synthase subunit alpha [Lentzea sp. NBRC 105346]
MNRFDKTFQAADRKMFIPFFTLGDPNREESLALIRAAVDAGADAVELGFPFSDPITDGPINQRSMARSLKAGMTYDGCVEMLRDIREIYPDLPIGLLLYYNLLFKRGRSAYAELADIGVDGVVCSDLPIDESAEHMELLAEHGLGCIQMVAPNTPIDRATRLFDTSSAFTYVISRFGTTGPSAEFEDNSVQRIEMLRSLTDKPIVVGFGVSKHSQVVDFWNAGADGVIVGSHFSLLVERNLDDVSLARKEIEGFVRGLRTPDAA